MKKAAVFIVLFLILAGAVWGQSAFTWTNGSGDGKWETPGNWEDENGDPATDYPGENNSGDTVNFASGANVSISSSTTTGNITAAAAVVITLEAGSVVNFGDITSNANITINVENNGNATIGNITSDNNITIDVKNSCTVTIGDINTDGDVKITKGTGGTVVVHEINAGGDTTTDSGVTVTITPPTSYTWSGATNSTWATKTNWVGGKSPGNGDAAYAITIPSTSRNPSFTGGTLKYATLTIQAGASLDIGTATLSGGTLVNNGNLILAGTATQNLNTSITQNGTVTFNAANAANGTRLAGLTSFKNLTIQNGARTNAGAITVSGDFSLAGGSLSAASIDVDGISNIGANVTTTVAQNYKGAVTLGGTATLAGSTVTFEDVIVGGGNSLTITGDGVFKGGSGIGALTVNGNFDLTGISLSASSVNVTGAMSTIAADITTTGNQTYGAVTLGGNLTLTSTTGTVTLGNITGATHSLTITGNGTFNNGGSDIVNLSVSGTSNINGDITTSGTQTYTGNVTLGGSGTRILTGTTVTLGTIIGASHSLTITGNGTFNGGTVTTPIGALSVNGDFKTAGSSTLNAASVSVTGTSNIGANVTTTAGNQTYGNVTLGNDVTLTTTTGTATLGTITGNGKSLTITGNAVLNSESGINNLYVSGTTTINQNITTTGTQTYTGNVTLGGSGDRTLKGTTVTLGTTAGNGGSLTIDGNGTFSSGGTAINVLSVSGDFSIASGTLSAASVEVDGASSIAGDVNTATGTQIYKGTVTLAGSVATRTLTGSTVTLGTIIGNAKALTIAGNGVFNGGSGVGALINSGNFTLTTGNSLDAASISVTGTSTINGDITTTGAQTYTGAATLGGSKRTINSQGGDISFDSTLNSSGIIELLATGGKITLGGATNAGQLIAIASGTVSTDAITVSSNGTEGTLAAIYIEADDFTPTTTTASSIVPGVSGQLCLVLSAATPWPNTNNVVAVGRWHDHHNDSNIIDFSGKNLIYGGTAPVPDDGSSGVTIGSVTIPSPYVYVSDTNVKTTFILSNNYSVYIHDANSNNTSGLTFETSGTGTINFIGTNNKFEKFTVKSAAGINIGSNVTATGTQTYSGTVTLSDNVTLQGTTVTLGTVTGATHSLTINGNAAFGGTVGDVTNLSVSGATITNSNITTSGTQTYGAVTLGGTVTLVGSTVTLGNVVGGGNSLTLTGNGVLNGDVTGINSLSVSGTATLGGAGTVRTLAGTTVTLGNVVGGGKSLTITGNGVLNGDVTGINNLYVSGTASSTGVMKLTAAGNINFVGAITTAQRLVAKAPNGTVSVNAITVTGTGNEGENAAIYINANTFVVTTTVPGSIVPGPKTSPWGQLCLELQSKWLDSYGVVDGNEDEDPDNLSATGARWHQHYFTAGKILYSFTEDSNGNGKLDRIRAQTNSKLSGNFNNFNVSVSGYEVDKTKGTNNSGYAILPSPNDDSFYIYLTEKDELDGGNLPHWSITSNTSLLDKTGAPIHDTSEIQYIDTIPPRIAYTLTLPGHTQTYVQMSEPTGSDITASFGGTSITASKPNSTGYLFTSVTYTTSVLVPLNITATSLVNGYFQMTNITDNATAPSTNGTAPKYPINWGYGGYAASNNNPTNPNVFVPPHRLLPTNTMTNLSTITPASNFTVIRRVTDVLISRLPATGDNYFVSPTFAKPQNDNKSISDFDGSKSLEKGPVEEGGIELRVTVNSSSLITNPQLFWTTADIPAYMRNPKEASSAKKIGGLWLPSVTTPSLLYYYVPLSSGIRTILSGTLISAQNYRYNIPPADLANSGAKFEFIFRPSSSSDMFIARLDAPPNVIPTNWYALVRPFGFNIQGMGLQRGGVTIMNNVINSDKRETAIIRYELTRSGRVTVQIYTLDGNLVKSIRRNEQLGAGEWTDTWDGTNNGGRAVARGMYFVRVVGPDIDEIRKIMVVK